MAYRLLYLGFLLLSSLLSHAQRNTLQQAQRYKEAYTSIFASTEFKKFRENQRCVAVFDSIVFQAQSAFFTELGKRWHYQGYRKEYLLRDSLDTVDEETRHQPYYSPLTANLTATSTATKGCAVVLFSRFQADILLAEVSINQEGGGALHNILSTFNQTVRYILFFRPDGKVQQYYTQVVSYN